MSETPNAESDAALCDLCGHGEHHDSDCGEVTGYDHLNGDHECGCPGSLAELLAQAWDAGFECCWESRYDKANDPPNPYRVLPPGDRRDPDSPMESGEVHRHDVPPGGGVG